MWKLNSCWIANTTDSYMQDFRIIGENEYTHSMVYHEYIDLRVDYFSTSDYVYNQNDGDYEMIGNYSFNFFIKKHLLSLYDYKFYIFCKFKPTVDYCHHFNDSVSYRLII